MSEETKEPGKEGAKKKGKAKLFIMLGAGAALAAAGGFGAVFLMGGGKKTEAATGEHGAAEASSAPPASASGEHGAAAAPGAAGAGGELLLPLDTYVVNLSDTRGDRFLKISIKAVTRDSTLEKHMNESELLKSRVRDRMLSILGAKTYPEISNPVGKEGLRRELAQELNAVLGPGSVSEILFTEFIVQ